VVSDTERSLAYYRDTLGLQVVGVAENHGVEQEHLNQVFGARLRITALRAERGPGIELLEYIAPPGGRPRPIDTRANDLIFWRTHLQTDRLNLPQDDRDKSTARPLAARGLSGSVLVGDPDGHALQIKVTGTGQVQGR
jgi:catechol 2,3-dioxygenase-like lactoylglutathione lyase family enzyme